MVTAGTLTTCSLSATHAGSGSDSDGQAVVVLFWGKRWGVVYCTRESSSSHACLNSEEGRWCPGAAGDCVYVVGGMASGGSPLS